MSDYTIFDVLTEKQKEYFSSPKVWNRPVPRKDWSEGEFYRNMRNNVWRKFTDKKFPASNVPGKSTHTLYVLSAKKYALRVCPTSTQYQYDRPCGYIPKNMPLGEKNRTLAKDVYILISYAFPLPPDDKFKGEDDLLYAGKVPYTAVMELD